MPEVAPFPMARRQCLSPDPERFLCTRDWWQARDEVEMRGLGGSRLQVKRMYGRWARLFFEPDPRRLQIALLKVLQSWLDR